MSNTENTNNNAEVVDEQLNSRLQETPIAIVGMASVFAESKNLSQFWDNIVESVNGIQDIPEDRWAIDDYYSSDKKEADKSYCKRGGFLPEIDFDPMEFGLPPNILELTDITQLMSLVVARDVLADAGIADEGSYDRDKMGIILGVGGGQKQGGQLMSRLQGPVLDKVLAASGVNENDRSVIIDKFKKAYIPWEENSFPGMLGNVIAGRIANRFNLGGTNCVVDAACAGSLAAIKMAVSDLLEYRSEMMLSGGVCCDNSPFMYMSFSKTPAFTDGEDIRPFDEKSNGMMIGEGVGMIALKRLEDAERDGDKVYAVIKGIGSSSDGRFKSIYAPRPEGQLKALKRAYADAGMDPKTCALIEAHGTGTKAGDAAEFRGLDLLFGENNEQKQHVALGSVKSQVGHTKAAAGTAGLIKAALALHHKVLPATINVDKPNQNLDIENTPLYINNETRPWMPRADGIKRRAGISSFGFGGTNFHFVLEEYKATQSNAYRLNIVPQTILITADNKTALIASLTNWLDKLNCDSESAVFVFNQLVSENPLTTPSIELTRCGFAAKDAQQAKLALEQIIKRLSSDSDANWSLPTGIYYRESGLDTAGKVVSLFSGQGSQYLNMGRELLCNFPSMLAASVQMDSQFSQAGQQQLSQVLYPIPVFSDQQRQLQTAQLQQTQFAQPAIGTFSVGLYKTFQQAGFNSDFSAGHSFGELTALWAAGVVSENDYMTLARSRGEAMSAPADDNFDAGTMIAVVGDTIEIAADIEQLEGVSIANYNSANQVVVAGETAQIDVATSLLKEKGYKVVALPVSAAFHTELVSHAQKPFAEVIDSIEFNKPLIPVYANGTAQAHPDDGEQIKTNLKNHILQSVRFKEEVDNIYDAGGRIFIEFGPKNVLTRLVDNILADKTDVTSIAINANPKQSADLQLRLAALQMAVLGVPLKNIDPYNALARPTVAPSKSPLAMKLTGAAYVSPKAKKAFNDALNDGWQLSTANSEEKVLVKEVIVEKVVEKIVYVNADGTPIDNTTTATSGNQDLVKSVEQSVAALIDQQSQLLNVHQEFMQGPQEYAKTFNDVLQSQQGTVALPESLDKTLSMYHEFQSETLRVHESYLNNQTQCMQQVLAELPHVNGSAVQQTVQSKTKKKAQSPVNNTLSIAEQLAKTHSSIEQNKVQPVPSNTIKQATVANNALENHTKASAVVVSNAVEKVMLDVVADKTGYPVEMLELSMDMEADLGIDSIKRVEILGAVQDEITDLPELDPEALAQLRTLAEIVEYMNECTASSNTAIAPVAQVSTTAAIDTKQIQDVMLAVVADKTGYPVEMLELSMDMEADLGIDSIKRVEILGAVQDEITDLPELDPEALAQLRTLAEIVNYMNECAASSNVAIAPVAEVPATTAIDTKQIQDVMLEVVADKTGYPTEMLELSMDMEADLGIDSIKRVEILGAVQDEITDLPELDPEALAQLRTLAEIVNYMNECATSSNVAITPVAQVSTSAAIDSDKIQDVMLEVVADKTGYPTEMLELSMDMEADLGIDSIKRVEILGAVQDEITDLPELDPEALAQLRTLAEIVNYMNECATSCNGVITPVAEICTSAAIDSDKIQDVMLEVVADKTGYPTEMLELSMDMEADLGIDSIKRVEILGAVQDEITDLPELDPEALAQLRTLAEIVNYMNECAASSNVAITPIAEVSTTAAIDTEQIQDVMLEVVADKTGYPVEMLELSMDMEADLGIDSIKRVEILGAVQDQISELPELDPEALAQLRTLVDIVTYMEQCANQKTDDKQTLANPETQEQLLLTVKDFEPAPSSIVTIKHLSPVTKIETQVNGENLLLVDDGEGCTVRLADQLSQLGWAVTVVKPAWVETVSSKTFADTINLISLDTVSEQEISGILATQAMWTSIIYLHPKNVISGIQYPQQSQQGLQLAFLLAKLSGLASNDNNDTRSSFMTLTRQGGAFAVDDNELNSDLVQSGLTGLVKTLALEWPNVFCRAIDVASKFTGDKVAKLIIEELNDSDQNTVEVGFNNNGRLTLVAQTTDSYALQSKNAINQDSLFLVSGGAKGVTAHCVIRLAQKYQAKFILLGRSVYESEEPSWAKGITEQSALKKAAMQHLIANAEKATPVTVEACIKPILANREISDTLQAIDDAGGLAEYVCADVTNAQNVSDAISPITDLWGEVTGIIHGAGVLADKFIEQKSLSDFCAVYSTKIDGLASLLACCEEDKLQHLVLFSSAAGFYGNPGQSDYAIANEILNKSAYRFKAMHPNTQVLSFNWGPWDGGMVTAELKRMFNDRGVYIIPLDAGAELLACELDAQSNRCVQILVGNDMGGEPAPIDQTIAQDANVKKPQVSRLTKTILAANNPFFADHKIAGNAVLPTVCAIAYMLDAVQTRYPDYQYMGLQNYKLFKGIVFDANVAEEYFIDLKLQNETSNALLIDVVISSENTSAKPVFHYAASIEMTKQDLPAQTFDKELPDMIAEPQKAALDLYHNGSLFHGASLQGIQGIHHCDQHGLLLSCKIAASLVNKQGEFDLQKHNVFANDLVYQAMLVWVRKTLGLGSLPASTLSWRVYQEVPIGEAFYLQLCITEQQGNKIVANIQLVAADKTLLADVVGAVVTSSENLTNLFMPDNNSTEVSYA